MFFPITFPHSVNVTFEESIGAFVPAFPDWFRIVLFLFGAIHLFFSLWMLIEYFLINWKNFRLPHFFYYPLAWYVCVHVSVCLSSVCVTWYTLSSTLYSPVCVNVPCLIWMLVACFLSNALHPFPSYWVRIRGYIPEQQYNHVNIFGLQTVYVMVSIHIHFTKSLTIIPFPTPPHTHTHSHTLIKKQLTGSL